MQTSTIFSSSLSPVIHLENPKGADIPKMTPRENDSVQVLDEMLGSIVSSIEPAQQSEFIEAIAKASISRKDLDLLLLGKVKTFSPLGSASGTTEEFSVSPLNGNVKPTPVPQMFDNLPRDLLHPPTPPKERTCHTIPNIDKLTRHLMVRNGSSDEGISAPKPRRQITVKHYSDATPSMHCHICCRSSKNIKVYACARIKEAICRKVVCSRCFVDNNWVYKEGWECSHCRGICPSRSQCFTYGRSNLRRKLQASKRKIEKSRNSATLVGPTLSPKLLNKKYASNTARNFISQFSLK